VDSWLTLENRHNGEILRMRRVRDAQGQIILELEGSMPPHTDGPPLHVHFREYEDIHVKAGTLGARVGTKNITVPTGGSASMPAGVPHRWWNAGDDLLQLSGHAAPAADLDRYLQAVFAVLNANPNGRPPIFYLAHVLWRHRETQLILLPPPPVQKILFPIVLFLGRILGKYRGSTWPGAPEACPGAPLVDGGILHGGRQS